MQKKVIKLNGATLYLDGGVVYPKMGKVPKDIGSFIFDLKTFELSEIHLKENPICDKCSKNKTPLRKTCKKCGWTRYKLTDNGGTTNGK